MDAFARRAAECGVTVGAQALERMWTYFRLLERWNATINLTGFRVEPDNLAAIDRLLIEPLLASRFADTPQTMIDVGSGGGSPAIPLAIAIPSSPTLTMVESRQRKAAFLREALRVTRLAGSVQERRFEDYARTSEASGRFDLLSIRAVRFDEQLESAAARVLRPAGRLIHFHEMGLSREPGTVIEWGQPEELLPLTRSAITVGTLSHGDRST